MVAMRISQHLVKHNAMAAVLGHNIVKPTVHMQEENYFVTICLQFFCYDTVIDKRLKKVSKYSTIIVFLL